MLIEIIENKEPEETKNGIDENWRQGNLIDGSCIQAASVNAIRIDYSKMTITFLLELREEINRSLNKIFNNTK